MAVALQPHFYVAVATWLLHLLPATTLTCYYLPPPWPATACYCLQAA